jgi:hypothetical protein
MHRTVVDGRWALTRRVLAMCSAAVLVLGFLALSPRMEASAAPVTPAKGPLYPTAIPREVAHPGSVIVAFRTPVTAHGARVDRETRTRASDADVARTNQALTALGAVSVDHLLTNIPAATLDAARARAERATHASLTDFTQVYQVRFDPRVNPGAAANRMAQAPLVSSAMPDFLFRSVSQNQQAATARPARAAAAAPTAPTAAGLPANAAYVTDAQSYHDAASNDVTGAAAMIQSRFGQQPGQGEVVTNISLGNINDSSTVLENGQRYLEQAGFPKTPVWLSSQVCTPAPGGGQSCSVALDPSGTTQDDQGDLLEVLLDFSVMSPPPVGDPRIVNPAGPGNAQILGAAYGASYRLINPKVNTTPNFFAAFLGAAFLQTPKPAAITASIGDGFSIGGFSDYFFEQDAMIHDIVNLVVNGGDVFVTISAGDGQTQTSVAMNPNGLTGPTEVTTDPTKITDINDPRAWANPSYSYGLTVEPQFVIDSGANDAGGNTLNDVYNNAPWNAALGATARHSQHTTETRWTGQQNFHSGQGSRVNLSAPGDDVLMLAQVEDASGNPVDPVQDFPRLIGGTSASSPEIAAGAAVVRQAAALLGHPLTARQTRDLLVATARPNVHPAFDLNTDNVGPALDVTRAVQTLFEAARVSDTPRFARMTVAERKAVLTFSDFRSSFWSDTAQDPAAHTATIDLSQGLVFPSGRTNETVGASGDNLFAPITFGVDAAFVPVGSRYRWTLGLGGRTVDVPNQLIDERLPAIRLLPSEIFGLLEAPVTAPTDRVVTVTARAAGASISTAVTFKGQAGATHAHAIPSSFDPVFRPAGRTDAKVRFTFDLTGVRDGAGGQVDGGVLLVSDIDRAVPQAFPDHDLDAHGFKRTLSGVTGSVELSAADFPHGVGTYGIAIRGTKGGREVADSTSFWLPLRYAPARQEIPGTPRIQAEASVLNGTAPLFYEAADTEPGVGSTRFAVTYDVRSVRDARNTVIEFSAPTLNFASALFVTGNFGPTNSFVNNFTNPNGDRLDGGDNFGQRGSVAHVTVPGTSGQATLDGAAIGLAIPAGACDSTMQVRVLAVDRAGRVVGVAGNPSLLSYADFSRAACFG